MRQILLTFVLLLTATSAWPQAITYQGKLQQGAQDFSGTVPMVFRLYSSVSGGTPIGNAVTRPNQTVVDGIFQVSLDFGSGAFDGTQRYLEIEVGGTTLSPRQEITATPVAAFALAGNPGPQGPQGLQGIQGPAGPANRLTKEQIAMEQWHLDPGRPTSISLSSPTTRIAFDGAHIWAIIGSNTLAKVDPATHEITEVTLDGTTPYDMAFDGTHLWLVGAKGSDEVITQFDPATASVIGSTLLPSTGFGRILFAADNLWITNSSQVSRFNRVSKEITATVSAGDNLSSISFDGTHLWTTNANKTTPSLSKISTDETPTSTLVVLSSGLQPWDATFDGRYLWVGDVWDSGGFKVLKFDPVTSNVISEFTVTGSPESIIYDGSHIYVATAGSLSSSIVQINPSTDTNQGEHNTLSGVARHILYDGTNIWVAAGVLHKVLPF